MLPKGLSNALSHLCNSIVYTNSNLGTVIHHSNYLIHVEIFLCITLSLIGSKWVGNFNDYQYSPEHLICMVPLLKSLFVNTCERISLFSMINMSEFFMPFPMFLSLLF